MRPEDFRNSTAGRLARTATGYWSFVPNPLPPTLSWSGDLIALLSEADRAIGELAGLGRSLPNPHLLIRPLMKREAVLSSRIEGTRTTLVDLYAYETAVQPPLFDIPDDVPEVKNYVMALEYSLKQLPELAVDLHLIRELHAHLLRGVRGKEWQPGEFRRIPNWIGPVGSTPETAAFVPPPVQEMHTSLDELAQFFSYPALPPLIRLGLIHVQFEIIHPFLDGNGRVGRLLLVLLLCKWGLLPQPLLYLSAFFEAHRQTYYDCLLGVSQRGAWEEWLAFFLTGITEQSREATLRIQRMQDLREHYRMQVQGERASARLLRLVDLLFAQPLITTSQVAEGLGVNFPMAQRYVYQLEGLGILRESSGRSRSRVYQADAVLAAIEEPLNGHGDSLLGMPTAHEMSEHLKAELAAGTNI